MALSGPGIALAVGGGLLVFAAAKDITPLAGLRAIASGKSPLTAATPHTSGAVDTSAQLAGILFPGTAGAVGAGGATLVSATSSAIANDALRYVGVVPYKYGGSNPSGWDCSGFIQYVLGHDLGIRGVPRTIAGQNLWPGATTIGASQAQPGDLVLFPYGLGPNAHGGILVAPGQYVNAPYTGTMTRVDPLPNILHGGPPVYRRVALGNVGTVAA